MKLLRILVVMEVFLFVGSLQARIVGGPVVTGMTPSSSTGELKGVSFSADVLGLTAFGLPCGIAAPQRRPASMIRARNSRVRASCGALKI